MAAHPENPSAGYAAENTSAQAPERTGLHLNVSPLLLCSVVAAAATTVALVVVAAIEARPPLGPPPGQSAPGAPGRPPPLPLFAPLVITAALFVVSWLAVLLAVCRDRILQRVGAAQEAMRLEIASLRGELAEYGETRETDGYLHGMRSATKQAPPTRLHPVPPSD